ncbi:hypothetical protein F5H01DRAFT_316547 [Linnemannia elongata]|nr:hypothetical protein F5H01DRAFT_316547 [Linnemannia elongata]
MDKETRRLLMDVEIAVSSRHPREASLFLKYSTLVNAQVPSTMKYPTLELYLPKSLVQLISKRKLLTEPKVRYFGKHIVEDVRVIHRNNVTHCNLNPENMLVSEGMVLKILGFESSIQDSLRSTRPIITNEMKRVERTNTTSLIFHQDSLSVPEAQLSRTSEIVRGLEVWQKQVPGIPREARVVHKNVYKKDVKGHKGKHPLEEVSNL